MISLLIGMVFSLALNASTSIGTLGDYCKIQQTIRGAQEIYDITDTITGDWVASAGTNKLGSEHKSFIQAERLCISSKITRRLRNWTRSPRYKFGSYTCQSICFGGKHLKSKRQALKRTKGFTETVSPKVTELKKKNERLKGVVKKQQAQLEEVFAKRPYKLSARVHYLTDVDDLPGQNFCQKRRTLSRVSIVREHRETGAIKATEKLCEIDCGEDNVNCAKLKLGKEYYLDTAKTIMLFSSCIQAQPTEHKTWTGKAVFHEDPNKMSRYTRKEINGTLDPTYQVLAMQPNVHDLGSSQIEGRFNCEWSNKAEFVTKLNRTDFLFPGFQEAERAPVRLLCEGSKEMDLIRGIRRDIKDKKNYQNFYDARQLLMSRANGVPPRVQYTLMMNCSAFDRFGKEVAIKEWRPLNSNDLHNEVLFLFMDHARYRIRSEQGDKNYKRRRKQSDIEFNKLIQRIKSGAASS